MMLEVTITLHHGPLSVSVECRVPLAQDALPSTRELAMRHTLTATTESLLRLTTPHAGGTDA
jgi:hypothetical protein